MHIRNSQRCCLFLISELIETAPCESSAHTLYKVALNICGKLAEGNPMVTDKNKNIYDVTHTIHQLLCQACTHCSEGRVTLETKVSHLNTKNAMY